MYTAHVIKRRCTNTLVKLIFNTMQSKSIPCNTMHYHAIPYSTMQYRAIPCYTMQYHAIPCNTMQWWKASLKGLAPFTYTVKL